MGLSGSGLFLVWTGLAGGLFCLALIFARFHAVVRRELAIPQGEVVVCGIALGKADPDAPANRLVPEREPVEGFTSWLD